jgi:hypothetical protein
MIPKKEEEPTQEPSGYLSDYYFKAHLIPADDEDPDETELELPGFHLQPDNFVYYDYEYENYASTTSPEVITNETSPHPPEDIRTPLWTPLNQPVSSGQHQQLVPSPTSPTIPASPTGTSHSGSSSGNVSGSVSTRDESQSALTTSDKWRRGSLWIKIPLPDRLRRYDSNEIILAKDATHLASFRSLSNYTQTVILLEIITKHSSSASDLPTTTPLLHNVIQNEKSKIIVENGKSFFHITFKCNWMKSNFVTGGVKQNRRNAQGIQTFLRATVYQDKHETQHQIELCWSKRK